MPLYEYECPVCGVRYERLRPWSQADAPTSCPEGHPGGQRVRFAQFMAIAHDAEGLRTAVPGTRETQKPIHTTRRHVVWEPPERRGAAAEQESAEAAREEVR